MEYINPVIPGFYPDPSVIRVGKEDYYLVTSSFEYFPGVPIFHSENLVDWKQIGSVLTRESQLNLKNSRSSGGVYAPTIRYNEGTFYMITTNVSGIGNFYVSAKDPRGPWSDPIKIPYGNIDPSLLFDDDGKVYVTVQNGAGHESHIIQYEIDIKTGEALTQPIPIFSGDGGEWTEAPHLYKIRDYYYLLTACGGTGSDHRAIIARSKNPYGPFEHYGSPILTHNQLPDHPIQNLGHADFVEDRHGNWWAVFLGTRPVYQKYTLLGRETFLAPIRWKDDWPLIDQNEGTVSRIMEVNSLSGCSTKEEGFIVYENFDEDHLSANWYFLRGKNEQYYSLTERRGWLRLLGSKETMNDLGGMPTFISKPQQGIHMEVNTLLDFYPKNEEEEAGVSARLTENAHCEIVIKKRNGKRVVVAQKTIRGITEEMAQSELHKTPIELSICSDEDLYELKYAEEEGQWIMLGKVPIQCLSKEENGGSGAVFTGVCVGLYATGNGKESTSPAYFDWIRYKYI